MTLKRKINEIIVHCTATEAGKNFTVDDVRKWHKKRGFRDIGYHYLILLDGTLQKGRAIEDVGAHCEGHNDHSLGICYVGGLRKGQPADTRTKAQEETLKKIIKALRDQLGPLPVHSHHYYNPYKACPCFNAEAEYNTI